MFEMKVKRFSLYQKLLMNNVIQALQQLDGYELYMERYAETRKKLD